MAETLDEAIDALARVKDEHRGILRTIAADEGMRGDTRVTLIEHLYAEEDEHVAEIRALAGGHGAAPAADPAPSALAPPSLTVGRLRAEASSPAAPGAPRPHALTGGTVGSLRADR